ncbi:sulfatase family protein [Aestuariibaculum suncheonense]|uniref:Sulfatase n=1 Tax=Aestuariibaculum suncheonense TaxID=1028745 RepID=A0A8J6QD39_9FLAO|nr:sulfatase [Aestuariibaculum suncheonense]MBD0834965.1 sulfatase [Aestuariibaculum suncheonense]
MNFKHVSALIISISLAVSCANTEKKQNKLKTASKRPNIIFIMSDDHAYQAISAYSDKLTTTPNIDRIANDGILFTNASVTNSICAPSRATILTGKHTHINGKIDNLSPFDTTQVTFPQLFQKAGYQTAMFGKLHFGNNPKGVDEFMILPGQGNYINPDFITTTGEIVNKKGYATDIITDMSIEWMDKKRDTTKPFLLMYLHKAPHRAWWPTPEKFDAYSKMTFPEPESLFDNYNTRGTAAKTAEMNILKHMLLSYDCKVLPEILDDMGIETEKRNKGMFNHGDFSRMDDIQKGLYIPTLNAINEDFKANWSTMNDEEKMRWKYQRYMQDYLACISSVDDNIGRVLDYLKEKKLEDNTIVVYTSDQGFYLGEHGWFDKRFMYNESFRTPLMIKWPNQIKPGITSDEMVQNLDFAQTFLEAAGIAIPDDMQGESLMPLLTGKTEKWTRDGVYYHYYEYPAEHAVKRHYGIATKKFKLIHFYYDVDEWELYDLKNDPHEMNNVYDNPEYAVIVTKLKNELADMRVKYKDSPELDQKFIDRYKENRNHH